MITEDYISFEIAKLLKEKGFNEMTELAYGLEHGHVRNDLPVSYWRNSEIDEYKFSCPTLQMAMKWLREVHNIFIQVELYSKYDNYCFELFQNTHRLMIEHREVYNSYEETAESAIKYCLEKLI